MQHILRSLAFALLLGPACLGQLSLSSFYTFVNVDYPGSIYSVPLGINNQRVVVGTFFDVNGVSHGYVWKAGKFTQVVDYPGVPMVPGGGTTAGGINDRGDIAGTYVDPNGFQHGYKLTRPVWCGPGDDTGGCKAAFHAVDVPGAAQTSTIYFELGPGLGTAGIGINNAGSVTGMYATQGLYSNGFVESGGAYFLIDHPRSSHTAGNGTKCFTISNTGVLACDYQTQASAAAPQITHGFLRSGGHDTAIDFPGSASAGFGTQVTGVNIFDVAVGTYFDGKAFNAMLWFGGCFSTVNYPKMPYSELHSINDRGDLTGAYATDAAGTVLHGYIAFPKL